MPCDTCVAVFASASRCYRIPVIIRSHLGTLLAFAEDRGADCSDDGDNHSLVLRRSHDDGRTWDPIIVVRRGSPPCDGCSAAISNPNPVSVTLPDGSSAILLHFTTLNNPQPDRHGHDRQIWSGDDGLTWRNETLLSYPPQENIGAMVGPSAGLQDSRSGTIYFSAHLAYSYWSRSSAWHSQELDALNASSPDPSSGGGASGDVAFLYWSHDGGTSWQASQSVHGLDECSLAFLPPGATAADSTGIPDVLMNCRPPCNANGCDQHRVQLVWRDGKVISGPTRLEGVIDPACQGSVVEHAGVLYLSNIASTHARERLTVRHSSDVGRTWSRNGTLIWAGFAAYSQLVPPAAAGAEATVTTGSVGVGVGVGSLGVLFEAGRASPYEGIWFTHVPGVVAPQLGGGGGGSGGGGGGGGSGGLQPSASHPSVAAMAVASAVAAAAGSVLACALFFFCFCFSPCGRRRRGARCSAGSSSRMVITPLVLAVAALLGCTSTLQGGVNSALANLLLRAGDAVGDADGDADGDATALFADTGTGGGGGLLNSTAAAYDGPHSMCSEEAASLVAASFVSFTGGLLCLVALNAADAALTCQEGRLTPPLGRPAHAWELLGGLVGCTVMLLTLTTLSTIGFALVSVLRAAGTAAASLTFDHVGSCGTPVRRMSARRVVGLVLLLTGSSLSASNELASDLLSSTSSRGGMASLLLASVLPLLGGALLPVQAS